VVMNEVLTNAKTIECVCFAHQVIELTEYRASLYEYLKHRMMAIAPNVTALVGELVGARLISHAGRDLNLFNSFYFRPVFLFRENALFTVTCVNAIYVRFNIQKQLFCSHYMD